VSCGVGVGSRLGSGLVDEPRDDVGPKSCSGVYVGAFGGGSLLLLTCADAASSKQHTSAAMSGAACVITLLVWTRENVQHADHESREL